MKSIRTKRLLKQTTCALLMVAGFSATASGQQTINETVLKSDIQVFMKQGAIPGVSAAIIDHGKVTFLNIGYADKATNRRTALSTQYEIGSCSKAFTALAILHLQQKGKIRLEDPVSDYLPWFRPRYKNHPYDISLQQLLNHTSGIAFSSISDLEAGNSADALEQTVRKLLKSGLTRPPGQAFEYATLNYDVLGLVISRVSGMTYEDFMRQEVFAPMHLSATTVGPQDAGQMARGYKTGFFSAQAFEAPYFRGNAPAGYIVSDIRDMSRWLGIQMGTTLSPFDSLAVQSQQPDMHLEPGNGFLYAAGWKVNPFGDKRIFHEGNNPNFSAHMLFSRDKQVGVVVLANSNSTNTAVIAEYLYRKYTHAETASLEGEGNSPDSFASVLLIVLLVYSLLIIGLMVRKFLRKSAGRSFKPGGILRFFLALLAGVPYIAGVWLLPDALLGFSWESIFLWGPSSLYYVVWGVVAATAVTYLYYLTTLIFPSNNTYRNTIPVIVLLSIISGLANTIVLFIITSAFYSTVSLYYLLFYFALSYGLYVIGMKISQSKLIRLTNELTFDIRHFLIGKIMRTSFQRFEQITDGKLLSTLNNDTSVIANSANVLISFISNFVTIVSAIIYMTTISPLSTLVIVIVVFLLVWYYFWVSARARVFVENSRTVINNYMSLLNNLVYGFKELSIHTNRKADFKHDFVDVSEQFRDASTQASIKFLNTTIIGNSFIIIVLGILSIVIPRLSLDINIVSLISFVMVLLYLIGPINMVMSTIQSLTSIRVSWDRIVGMIAEVSGKKEEKTPFWDILRSLQSKDTEGEHIPDYHALKQFRQLKADQLAFVYGKDNPDGQSTETFGFGPVDLTINAGEIVFIIGGNGSGKSTFVKLLTGLYVPDGGGIAINGERVEREQLGEYFSVVFSGDYHFKKLFGIPLTDREQEIEQLISKMHLEEKVSIENQEFSTIDLSGGQRKRLALLKCYLEDRPVFVFDEFAADQDPEFRNYFYRELLPELRRMGKTVIAITHDDHYFDTADKVVKFDYGCVEYVQSKNG